MRGQATEASGGNDPRRLARLGLTGLLIGAFLAGCTATSGTGGPTAAIFGGDLERPASGAAHRQRGAQPHRRRLRRHLPRPQGRAGAGADRQPHRGGIGQAGSALSHHHPQRAGGQRLRAPRRLSLRHARPARARQRFVRGGGGAGPRDGARDRQPRHRSARTRRATRRSSAAPSATSIPTAASWRLPPASARSPASRSSRSSRPTPSASGPSARPATTRSPRRAS
jgi:hypothetical protein